MFRVWGLLVRDRFRFWFYVGFLEMVYMMVIIWVRVEVLVLEVVELFTCF